MVIAVMDNYSLITRKGTVSSLAGEKSGEVSGCIVLFPERFVFQVRRSYEVPIFTGELSSVMQGDERGIYTEPVRVR
jgi:hypothetical protein